MTDEGRWPCAWHYEHYRRTIDPVHDALPRWRDLNARGVADADSLTDQEAMELTKLDNLILGVMPSFADMVAMMASKCESYIDYSNSPAIEAADKVSATWLRGIRAGDPPVELDQDRVAAFIDATEKIAGFVRAPNGPEDNAR